MKKIIYSLTIVSFLGLASCVKSLDINDNPNVPSSIDNNSQLAGSLLSSARLQTTTMNEIGSFWGGYWAKASDIAGTSAGATQSQLDMEVNYTISNSFATSVWDNQYLVIYNFQLLKEQTEKSAPAYAGIANVIEALHFMQLSDYYNNVPFSEALNRNNTKPKYDNGLDVYKGSIRLISEAIDQFKNVGTTAVPNTSDILFKGNLNKWIKFANTLKLRALLQLSNLNGEAGYISTEIAKIVAEGSGFLTEDAIVNPGFSKNANQQNPFWDTYYQSYAGVTTTLYTAVRPTKYIVNLFNTLQDPRLNAIYLPSATGNVYAGVELGSSSADQTSARSSAFRVGGVLKSATAGALYFSAAESCFLQAEAIQRGWLSGDANVAYTNGIKASMNYLGVATTDQNTYLAQVSVNLNAATNKLNQIITQKWLALNSISGTVAFNDFRRLGLPADVPGSISYDNSGKSHPTRLVYPTSEQNANMLNMLAQGNIDPMNTKVFWMP